MKRRFENSRDAVNSSKRSKFTQGDTVSRGLITESSLFGVVGNNFTQNAMLQITYPKQYIGINPSSHENDNERGEKHLEINTYDYIAHRRSVFFFKEWQPSLTGIISIREAYNEEGLRIRETVIDRMIPVQQRYMEKLTFLEEQYSTGPLRFLEEVKLIEELCSSEKQRHIEELRLLEEQYSSEEQYFSSKQLHIDQLRFLEEVYSTNPFKFIKDIISSSQISGASDSEEERELIITEAGQTVKTATVDTLEITTSQLQAPSASLEKTAIASPQIIDMVSDSEDGAIYLGYLNSALNLENYAIDGPQIAGIPSLSSSSDF